MLLTTTLAHSDVHLIVSCLRRAIDADPEQLSMYERVHAKMVVEDLLSRLPESTPGRAANS